MGVRFDTGARRSIVAATIEAEKHGRPRPIPIDLLMGLMSLPESPVSSSVPGLGAEARALIAVATAGPAGEGNLARNGSPEDAERILRHAAELASARGPDSETGILDILAAALASLAAPGQDIGAPLHAGAQHALRSPGPAGVAATDRSAANAANAASTTPTTPTTPTANAKRRANVTDVSNVSPAAAVARTATVARSGIGYDSHRFGDVGPLILGGVIIPESARLVGHSDGDAIAHAITDAILGAAGAGDIGEMFSDTDPANRGRDSLQMLRAAVQRIATLGFVVHQVDATVVAEQPKISRYRDAMRAALAAALGITPDRVSVKGKTNEGMGWIGRGEGIACVAIATLATSPAP